MKGLCSHLDQNDLPKIVIHFFHLVKMMQVYCFICT